MSWALLEAKEQQEIGQALPHEAKLEGSNILNENMDIIDPAQR